MEQFFPWLLSLFLILFLYMLILPLSRHLLREKNERQFTQEFLHDANQLYGFRDREFVIMSEKNSFLLSQGEENARQNTPGR